MQRTAVLRLSLALAGLSPVSLVAAGNWTPAQQEVADVFKAFSEAEQAGDLALQISLTAPAFTAWNLATPGPMDRATYQKAGVTFFQHVTVEACD